jgi:hypothetical protein
LFLLNLNEAGTELKPPTAPQFGTTYSATPDRPSLGGVRFRFGFVNLNGIPQEFPVVKALDGFLGLFFGPHFYKAESPAQTRISVFYDIDGNDRPSLFKVGFQVRFGHGFGQIADIKILAHSFLLLKLIYLVHVHSLLAFSPRRDLKFHFFIFLKGFETLSADRGMVDKQVVPAFAADKPKPLTLIEPFHSTFYHLLSPFRFWFAKWLRRNKKAAKSYQSFCGLFFQTSISLQPLDKLCASFKEESSK